MNQIDQFANKKVFVLGMGMTGPSVARLLHAQGCDVLVNDGSDEEHEAANLLRQQGIQVISGSHPLELLDASFDYVIKNPGIPYSHPLVVKAQQLNIPIYTDIELAGRIAKAPIIGVTASNGKTTTTTLIADMINAEHPNRAHKAGNIGIPAIPVAEEASAEDIIVMELSSFQLKGVETFHPHIAVIPNIYEAHIDYHQTRADYVASKLRLLRHMTASDYVVVNQEQPELVAAAESCAAQVVFFSQKGALSKGTSLINQSICYDGQPVVSLADVRIPGTHNIENLLAAVTAAKLCGISSAAIARAVRAFTGVKHRTQYVATVQGRTFYNDAKATNMIATEKALAGFVGQSVVLIAGGLDRRVSFDPLVPSLRGLSALVVYGETKDQLARAGQLAGVPIVRAVATLPEAVAQAYQESQDGDVILLSPACASWDQFKNFEERGDCFIDSVARLAASEG